MEAYGGILFKKTKKHGDTEKNRKMRRNLLSGIKDSERLSFFNSTVVGLCYTQLYDIEQKVNGLYTFDRKPKFDSEIFRKINQQKSAIKTKSKNF